jgi:diguanylate cyclase (GGDEF)-like protein
MRSVTGILTDARRLLWWPRDPFFDDAAAAGELVVARLRLLVFLFLLIIQLFGWETRIHEVGLIANVIGLVWAGAVLVAVRRLYRAWMGFVSSVVDVSLVSAGLLALVLTGRPDAAVNSKVLFEVYFLMLGFCAFRYDWRICILAGAITIGQFLGLMTYTQTYGELDRLAGHAYGAFSWSIQWGRIVLLTAATAVTTLIVARGQRFWKLAATDRLTGLYNRGYFDERLLEEAHRAQRYDRSLTIAILDIDHFKQVNDTYGHARGDAILRTLAAYLQRWLRRTDVAARYGGEEFVLLLPETAPEHVLPRLDALREQIAEAFGFDPGKAPGITISMGVAGLPADGTDIAPVLETADARLYEAKRSGRNCVRGPAAAV